MLHNFAGNIEMYGILDAVASGPIEAQTSESSTMVRAANICCFNLNTYIPQYIFLSMSF